MNEEPAGSRRAPLPPAEAAGLRGLRL